MAKKSYIGVDNKARKIKKWYIGVDSKARKVKKAYIGVGGVARPFFTGIGEVIYYGTATGLNAAKTYLASASIGDYALFGGGYTSNGSTTTRQSSMIAYDSNLVQNTSITALRSYGHYTKGAAAGSSYAVFAGGGLGTNNTTAYSPSLTRTTGPNLSSNHWDFASLSFGNYAMFFGGLTTINGSTRTDIVEAISSALVKTNPDTLTTIVAGDWRAAKAGNYALVATDSSIDVYSSSLVKSSINPSHIGVYATNAGDNAIFVTGSTSTAASYSTAFSKDLVSTALSTLSQKRGSLVPASIKEYALFVGGYYPTTYYSCVDIYSSELVHSIGDNISRVTSWCTPANAGDYLLIAGGHSKSVFAPTNAVDVFQYS